MAHKCDNCFYRTDWTSGTGIVQYPICEREWWRSFEECKVECGKPGECEFKVTKEEAEVALDLFFKAPDDKLISEIKEETKRIVEEDLEKARLED